MKLYKLTQLTALSAALLGSTSFAASNDALLDLLVQKGVLTDTEASDVAAELKEEKPTFVTAKGKAVTDLKLTGRLHFQYDSISNDGDDSTVDGFYFRRLYFGAEAKFFNNYYGTLIANYEDDDGDIGIDKAIVGWKYDPRANFEAGYTKVPFGYYETSSSSRIKTVERSIANRYFVEGDGLAFGGRHTGLFASGDLGAGFEYEAALVQSTASNDRNDSREGDDRGLGAFARLQWTSEKTDAGQFMVGADLGMMQDGNRQLNSDDPTNPLVTSEDSDLIAYGIHGEYRLGRFLLTAEALATTVDNVVMGTDEEDIDVFGFTLTPSYQINDKWEVVAAYSYIDTGGADLLDVDNLVRRSNVSGNFTNRTGFYSEGTSYYIGFNYYIVGNDLKLTGGYEFADFEDTNGNEVKVDAFRLRLQALF